MFKPSIVKDAISCVATSLAAMLDAEVMILDNKRNVISGTVPMEKKYHISQIYDYILTTNKVVVLENPGHDPRCKGCRYYGNCKELLELDAPILAEGECVGLISVVCYHKEQRDHILSIMDECCTFITQMCQLIASHVQEGVIREQLRISSARLSAIINAVDEGIISLDKKDCITFSNRITAQILGVPEHELTGQNFREFCPEYSSKKKHLFKHKQEMAIINQFGEKVYYYVAASTIMTDGVDSGTIITLEEQKKISQLMGRLISNNQSAFDTSNIISCGESLAKVKQRAIKASKTDSTILIQGESGTGKELFARAIHNMSQRSSGPFITLNCAAIPETLLESELFGYESGAFTGARKGGKPGHFELADTGSIFLDEIGDMPIYLQAKILRVLQEKTIQRIGGTSDKSIDIRIITATNKNLEKLVQDNRFRQDLFYRLNVIPLMIPPLRERGSADIELLITYFLKKYEKLFAKDPPQISEDAYSALITYSWPGNVRELENAIEYMLNMETDGTITMEGLPESVKKAATQRASNSKQSLKMQLFQKEKEIIIGELEKYGKSLEGKKTIADNLDIGIASLYRKLREYDLL